MINKNLFNKTLLALAVGTLSSNAIAAGFQLNAQSATGIGRAFSGDAVIADNASVMARNPAAMALFDKTELSLGFEAIVTDIKVSNATYTGPMGNETNADYDDAGGTSIAPNIHLIVPVNDKFAWGMNAYSNFGTRTDFSDDFAGSEYGGLTDVKSANIGFAGSYRINEQFSVGAGLDIIYGQGSIKRSNMYLGDIVNVDEATGWALGFNLGGVYEMNERNRFGLSYRFSPEVTAEDDANQEIVLPLPDMVEFSGYHELKDTNFAVHYSLQYFGWSAFDKIEFSNLTGPMATYSKSYEWQNSMHASIGGTYFVNDKWTVRTGIMHDTSAQSDLTSVSVPDSNRNWLSAGFTYNIDSASNIDFGFTYLIGQDTDVTESTANPSMPGMEFSSITATTRADAILVGLQYSRSF